MKNLRPDVKSEYEYSLDKYCPKDHNEGDILSELDVFNSHFVLADFFLETGELARYGILNFDMLSSAVARQTASYGGYFKWKDDITKIATLAFGLTKNHAFQDGNKRTALLSIVFSLHRLNRTICCRKKDLEILLVRLAANEMDKYKDFKKYTRSYGDDATVMYISDFVRKNSRKIESNFRTMTFEEFNKKLKIYDIWLDNPQANHINVYQKRDKKRFFFLPNKTETIRILQIGFPGWKRQINPKAVKSVLSASGLTIENGFDLKRFYEGAEPEYQLIEEYFSVLKRLKDE